jgi:RNA polymerase sigma-70 factor (ECF subfamily)
MTDANPFADFLTRIRAGDERAAAELVAKYEPAIRLEVRMRLRSRRLRQLFDSMDICQSVLGSFFVRAALGQYELAEPQQLVGLLVGMTRNKLAHQIRKQRTQSRDFGRLADVNVHEVQAALAEPGPGHVAAGRDVLDRFRARLSEEERRLADLRGQGLAWAEIAGLVGGNPQARRMQLARAANRVAAELGLEL